MFILSVGFAQKYLLCLGLVIFLLSMCKVLITTEKYFNQSIWPLTTNYYYVRNRTFKGLWKRTCICYKCSKDLHINGMHDGTLLANLKSCQKRINLSNQSKTTGSLESSPSFWMWQFKTSVKPRQSWLTQITDGNIKSWKCQRKRL